MPRDNTFVRKCFAYEQIISILREAEDGVSTQEQCRWHSIFTPAFYISGKKYGEDGSTNL